MPNYVIENKDGVEFLKHFNKDEIDLLVTDLPYNVVHRKVGSLRKISHAGKEDMKDADISNFNMDDFLSEVIRTCRQYYIFSSTEQISQIRSTLSEKFSTRTLCWEKCIGGSTRIYCKTPTGYKSRLVKDIYKTPLDKLPHYLWDGIKWNRLLKITKNNSPENILKIELRSGEKIHVTGNHRFPTERGLLSSEELIIGDILIKCNLPDSEFNFGNGLTQEIPWLLGIYLAEGSVFDSTAIQLDLNIDELYFEEKILKICNDYCGKYYKYIDGNKLKFVISGQSIIGIINQFIKGKSSKEKHLSPEIWNMKNDFLKILFDSYLLGDGHFESKANRFQLGFTRNKLLVDDIRLLCSRLGLNNLRLCNSINKIKDKEYLSCRGTLSLCKNHHSCKNYSEILKITKIKVGKSNFYDLEVESDPHLFSLSSGILTHNSNPVPFNGQHMWLSSIELISWGKKAKGTFKEFCKSGVFRYPIPRGDHPTTKPIKLLEYLINTSSNENDLIVDPFMGSGTTLAAAINLNRKFAGNDLNIKWYNYVKEKYV